MRRITVPQPLLDYSAVLYPSIIMELNFKGYIKHPETGKMYPPESWEINHTVAEMDLVNKAQQHNGHLTDVEREQLIALSGPIFGKALGNPSSLTEEERRLAMGWPPAEQCRANIAAVGLGDLAPEEILAKIVAGHIWLNREQSLLVVRRFHLNPPPDGDRIRETLPYDQSAANILVATTNEATAFFRAKMQWDRLQPPKSKWARGQARVKQFAIQAADRAREEKDPSRFPLATLENFPLATLSSLPLSILDGFRPSSPPDGFPPSTPEWVKQVVRERRQLGFNIYKTSDVRTVFDDFAQLQPRNHAVYRFYDLNNRAISFDAFWKYFLDTKVFGDRGDICHMRYLSQATYDTHPVCQWMTWFISDLEVPAASDAEYRAHHRSARIQWKGTHHRYFLVMDLQGFPPITHILRRDSAIFPEVWVCDADWEPPADGDGVHDEDGYKGRVRVRIIAILIRTPY